MSSKDRSMVISSKSRPAGSSKNRSDANRRREANEDDLEPSREKVMAGSSKTRPDGHREVKEDDLQLSRHNIMTGSSKNRTESNYRQREVKEDNQQTSRDRSMAGSSGGNLSRHGSSSSRDPFTHLLKQLSALHREQIHKLEYKVDVLKRKLSKTLDTMQINADYARDYYRRNKQLEEENARLRKRLAQLGNQQTFHEDTDDNLHSVSLADGAKTEQDPVLLENEPETNSTHGQVTQQSAKINKLSKGRTNKKVRYTELDGRCTEAAQESSQNHRSQRDVTNEQEDQYSEVQQTNARTSYLTDEIQGRSATNYEPAQTLVPETCNPSLEMESSNQVDHPSLQMESSDKPYGGGDNRLSKKKAIVSIPETLAPGYVQMNLSDESDQDDYGFEPPTSASTPNDVSHYQRDDYERAVSRLVEGNSNSPELKRRDDTNHGEGREEIDDAAEVDFDETNFKFATQDNQRKTSIPKSESQYPVDFVSTQVPSPTFCGGRNDDEDEVDEDEVMDHEHNERNIDVNNKSVKTPSNDRRNISFKDAGNDDSYQSEASMLLLQPPSGMSTPGHASGQRQEHSREDDVRSTTPIWKKNPRKRKIPDEDFFNDEDGIDKNDVTDEVHDETNYDSRVTVKSRKDQSKDLTNDEMVLNTDIDYKTRTDKERGHASKSRPTEDGTMLDSDIDGKENSPPSHNLSLKTPSVNFSRTSKLDISEASSSRGGKFLKQSKLSPSMFQSKDRGHNASLIAQYNGKMAMNLDTQSDESIAKAIELSLLASVGADTNNEAVLKTSDDFKIPSVPRRKKTSKRSVGQVDRSPEVSTKFKGNGTKMRNQGNTNPHHAIEADDHVVFDVLDNNDGERNSKLSRKKRRGNRNGKPVSTADVGIKRGQQMHGEEEDMDEDGSNNSCADLFGDDDEMEEHDDGDLVAEDDYNRSKDSSGRSSGNQSMGTMQIVQAFDRLPNQEEKPAYKYVDVVRKKEERQRMKAFDCKQCEQFYSDMKLTNEEREERMKACSRHRAHFSPPSTPEHYWSIGFPDTQTCLQRGYMQIAESTDEPNRKRGSKKYKQLF